MNVSRALLWAISLAVALAACIPAAYLALRAGAAPDDAWELLLTARSARLLANTLGLAATVTGLAALLALPLAWLTVQSNLPARRLFTVLLTLPLAVPSFIFGYVVLAAFGTGGLFDTWGLPTPPIYGFWGAAGALTISTFPFLFLAFRAALLREDPGLLEAAATLGASPPRAFVRVTLPRLVQALRSGGLLVAFYVLSDFGAVSLLQYDTFSRAIFMQLEGSFDRSLAALWSLALMLLAVVTLVLSELGRGGPAPRGGRPARERQKAIELGGWAAPALLLAGLTVALGVGLPVLVIGVWMVRSSAQLVFDGLVGPAYNSLLASGLAALAALLASVPLGYIGARWASVPSRVLVRAAYAGYCLPPVVVALSLVSFGIHVLPALYGTLALLVFAHAVRFLPQSLGPVHGAFLDLSPRLSEAGASLGRPPLDVARTIALPLLRPGLVAGATLVFLTAMKELPATLLLAPIGFQTLSTRIWTEAAEGRFDTGALPALTLVLISGVSVAWTLRQEAHGRVEETP